MVLNLFWLISLSMIFSRSIPAVANGSISSLLMAEKCHICTIQSSTEGGHFGRFKVLTAVSNAAVNTGLHTLASKCFSIFQVDAQKRGYGN